MYISSQIFQMIQGNVVVIVQSLICVWLCDLMDCSTPGFPVHHQFPELAQTHVHQVSDAIQPSHPLSSPSPPAFNLSQHQSLFQRVSSSHQVAKVLEFQLQHQSFQWILRTDFLWDWLVWSPCSPRDSSLQITYQPGSCMIHRVRTCKYLLIWESYTKGDVTLNWPR